jgi:hypothetical protein
MLIVYSAYLFFFPLLPNIDPDNRVFDIEILLRDGRKWFSLLYIAGLGTIFFAYWRMLKIVHAIPKGKPKTEELLSRWVLGIGILCALTLISLYPITALDVFLYVVRARLWTFYGGSPMTALPANFPQDPFSSVAGEFAKQPSPYGPVWELTAQIPMHLGFTDLGNGVIAMKVISLIAYIGMAILIGWYSQQDTQRYGVSRLTALTFFALNPLVLMQAIGNGHNDMLMLFFITLGLILWQRDRWQWATLALTLAALVKVTGLILLPLFGVAVLLSAPDWRTRITRGLSMASIFVVTSLIAYRITGPIPEVFAGARDAALGRLGYTPAYAIRVLLRAIFPENRELLSVPANVLNILFILYYLYLLVKLVERKMTLLEAGFMAFFCQLILGSTFRIWYPMWLIPFAALNLNSGTYWRTLLFSITAELSILSYYILWRWKLSEWDWALTGPLKAYWDYWLVMTWLNVPWTFGIPILGPLLLRRRDRQLFEENLSV